MEYYNTYFENRGLSFYHIGESVDYIKFRSEHWLVFKFRNIDILSNLVKSFLKYNYISYPFSEVVFGKHICDTKTGLIDVKLTTKTTTSIKPFLDSLIDIYPSTNKYSSIRIK